MGEKWENKNKGERMYRKLIGRNNNDHLTFANFRSNSTTCLSSSAAVDLLAPSNTATLVMYLWYACMSPSLLDFK